MVGDSEHGTLRRQWDTEDKGLRRSWECGGTLQAWRTLGKQWDDGGTLRTWCVSGDMQDSGDPEYLMELWGHRRCWG